VDFARSKIVVTWRHLFERTVANTMVQTTVVGREPCIAEGSKEDLHTSDGIHLRIIDINLDSIIGILT
jgi:hypothetical protein